MKKETQNLPYSAVNLSQVEAMYLRNVTYLPDVLAQVIESGGAIEANRIVVLITGATSELFRTVFTERLAKIGFDSSYELTSEGKMLEALIDRFYVI